MQNGIYSQELRTVCNAVIQIGDIDDTGKGRHFVSKFIQDGLVKIEGHGIVLLKKETIDQSLQSMVGAPVIIKHQDVTNENADELRCGVISKAYFNDFDGWYYCEGIIWDEKAKELVNNGWSVSCSYDYLAYNDEGGEENNIHYDKEFTQLNFTHLALVDNPRYERANIVFNSKDEEKGKWITINGNHIFIPDGKTLDEVIKEKGWGNKENKQSDGDAGGSDFDKKYSEIEKLIKDKNFEPLEEEAFLEDLNDFKREYDKNLEPRQEEALLEELADFKDKILDKYPKFNNPKKDEGKDKQEPEWLQREKQKLDRQTTQMYEDRYSTEHPETYKKNLEEAKGKQSDSKGEKKYNYTLTKREVETNKMLGGMADTGNYYTNGEFAIDKKYLNIKGQEPTKNEEIEKPLKNILKGDSTDRYTPVKDFEIGELKREYGKPIKVAKYSYYDEKYGYERHIYLNKKYNDLFKNFDLKFGGEVEPVFAYKGKDIVGVVMPIYAREQSYSKTVNNEIEEELTEDKNQLKLKIDNSKEQDMALLEEIKKLITRVENNKENEMEIENAKVDKRDIIRQIMAIAGKEEASEDVKTIAKLAEKLAYDKSEAGTADNEMDKENPDDKKEVKEIKEDVKEDIDNKCKNSKPDTSSFDKINEIYNSIKQVTEESNYVSRQEKLDNAVEYFK